MLKKLHGSPEGRGESSSHQVLRTLTREPQQRRVRVASHVVEQHASNSTRVFFRGYLARTRKQKHLVTNLGR